jgi:hypothetical protein
LDTNVTIFHFLNSKNNVHNNFIFNRIDLYRGGGCINDVETK